MEVLVEIKGLYAHEWWHISEISGSVTSCHDSNLWLLDVYNDAETIAETSCAQSPLIPH